MLEIRTRLGRKGVRVDLFRKYKHADEKTGKPTTSYKQLGSFSLNDGCSPELAAVLPLDEKVQLDNWLSETQFAAQFNVEADALSKCVVRMPPPFCEALARLSLEAQQAGIDFVPHRVMLESLLRTAKLLQQKLDKINGFKSGILENIGIASEDGFKKEQKNAYDKEGYVLFNALLALGQPLGKICTELEAAARRYGKVKKIAPPQLHEWAGKLPNRHTEKPIKKWVCAIAIDVLHQHHVDPMALIKPEKVAEYWAIQRQKNYTLKEAVAQFTQTFGVSPADKPAVTAAITRVYQKLASV